MRATLNRLRLRFGPESEVAEAHADALAKSGDLSNALEPWRAGDEYEAHKDSVSKAEKAFGDAEERFLTAARAVLAEKD